MTNPALCNLTLCALLLAPLTELQAADAAEVEPMTVHRVVAVDNVCAWPNLTLMRDGTIIVILHNQPSHGMQEGDVDCWASMEGEKWEKRGNPAPNDPHTVRMNHAAGLAGNGDLLVLCSGWTDEKQPERPKQSKLRDNILRTWVCRSGDGGRTWTRSKDFPAPEAGWSEHIPFGNIFVALDGSLRTSCYQGKFADPTKSTRIESWRSWQFRSDDDGSTWSAVNIIGPRHNETALFHAGGKRWLAAARIEAMDIFASLDDGESWSLLCRPTARNEINGHLQRLKDDRLLLSYGVRIEGQHGVKAKLSSDEGKTWSDPIRLARSDSGDCGYPMSVQRADGKIITAYYSKSAPECDHYHMGVAIWDAPASP